jgi:hypothetical protein
MMQSKAAKIGFGEGLGKEFSFSIHAIERVKVHM